MPHIIEESRDGSQRTRREKPEFFQSGTGPRGGVCVVYLGSPRTHLREMRGAQALGWPTRKNGQGRLVTADGLFVSTGKSQWDAGPQATQTGACGRVNHGAQDCPRAETRSIMQKE
jgi:hypothetical protein